MAILNRKTTSDPADKAGGLTAAKITERAEKAFAYTSDERRKHLVTVSMVEGDQWVAPRAGGAGLQHRRPDRDTEQKDLRTENELASVKATLMAKLMTPLTWDVIPKSSDDSARTAARTSEQVCRATMTRLDVDDIDRRMVSDGIDGGTSAVYVLWDANAGSQLGVNEDTGEPFGEGDVVIDEVDIRGFAFEPGCTNPRFARWWVLRRAMPPQEAQELYGLDEEPNPDVASSSHIHTVGSLSRPGAGDAHLVEVLTLFERPHGKHKGGVWTVIGDRIVEHTEWPFPFTHKLNVAVFGTVPQNGRWPHRSRLWDCIENQVAINLAKTREKQNLDKWAKLKLITPMGSLDTIDADSDIIEVDDPGLTPAFLTPPPLPQWVLDASDREREAMRGKVGISDVTEGNVPQGVQAASALAILDDNANQGLHPYVRSRASVWAQVATMVMEIYEDRVTEEEQREAEVADSEFFASTVMWSGAMLAGHTDVQVPVDRIMPVNRAAALAQADTLHAAGWITSARQYAAVAHIQPTEDWLASIDPQWSNAVRVNWLLYSGHPQPAMIMPLTGRPVQDPQVQIEARKTFMLTSRFAELGNRLSNVETVDPETGRKRVLTIQELFYDNLQMWETISYEQAGQLAVEQQMSPVAAAAPGVRDVPDGVADALGQLGDAQLGLDPSAQEAFSPDGQVDAALGFQ